MITRVKVEFARHKGKKKSKKKGKSISLKNQFYNNPYQLLPSDISAPLQSSMIQLYLSNAENIQIKYKEFSSMDAGKMREIIINIYE